MFSDAQQLAILRAYLRGNVKTKFARHTLTGDNAAAQVQNLKDWLKTKYHTEEVKQGIKDQLDNLAQQLNETPQGFYV